MKTDVTFMTLRIFSATGGIEKVCRILGKALYERTLDGTTTLQIISSHDQQQQAFDNRYFPSEIFKGWRNKRPQFVFSALKSGVCSKKIILSHVNLLPIGWLVKLINPKVKLILLAHGIEVWSIPMGYKEFMLKKCDSILCVSAFTRQQMITQYALPPEKMLVFNNCLDPFLNAPVEKAVAMKLRKKYGLNESDKVLFTLTRMESGERYKGYDRVIEALSQLHQQCPQMKYLIGGSYEASEKLYIDQKINKFGLLGKVLFAGFIPEDELAHHFEMCDYYVMPSYNEGFGIVFIEALYYGLPVVAGNKDGSVDALEQGKWGMLIDPLDIDAIKMALKTLYDMPVQSGVVNRKDLLLKFGYEAYKVKLENLLQKNHE